MVCGHRFVVDLEWVERWEQSGEKCLGCGLTCEHKDAPRVMVDPDDPVIDDDRVAQFSWYHTSTQPDWPTRDFDPAEDLTPETCRRMGGGEHVTAWAARQRAKALHVGTYEAAVHNMPKPPSATWTNRNGSDSPRSSYTRQIASGIANGIAARGTSRTGRRRTVQ